MVYRVGLVIAESLYWNAYVDFACASQVKYSGTFNHIASFITSILLIHVTKSGHRSGLLMVLWKSEYKRGCGDMGTLFSFVHLCGEGNYYRRDVGTTGQ